MSARITVSSIFVLLLLIMAGCGGDDEGIKKVKPNRNTFMSGTTSSQLAKESLQENPDEINQPLTVEEYDAQWQENLKVADESINKTEMRPYLSDPKGPGNAGVRVTMEQVGEPIIYVKEVDKLVGSKKSKVKITYAKIKFKMNIENKSKQDCMKVSLKLYVYDRRGNRMTDREQTFFYKDIPAGKTVSKELVLEDLDAHERPKAKDFIVDFSKTEVFVTDSKYYFN